LNNSGQFFAYYSKNEKVKNLANVDVGGKVANQSKQTNCKAWRNPGFIVM